MAEELKRQGEKVIFYSTDQFASLLKSKGLIYQPYPHVAGMFDWGIEEKVININEGISRVFKIYSRHFSEEHKQFEDFVAQECLKQKADYTFYDYFDGYWGKSGSLKVQVPAFSSVTTFAVCNAFFQQYAAECLRYIWRVPTDEFLEEDEGNAYSIIKLVQRKCRVIFKEKTMNLFEYGNSDFLNIVHTPIGLQPHNELFDDRFLFIGSTTKDNRDTHFLNFCRHSDQPLLYLSLIHI